MSTDPAIRPERPLHTRPRAIALVAVGGALGTAVRVGVAAPAGGWDGAPWATWAVNVSGAFVLGVLLERLVRSGPDDGRRRDVRLLAGTGFLGGYTTYSTLALDTVTLVGTNAGVGAGTAALGTALLYAGSSLVLGVVAAAAGLAVGRRTARA
ncbi:CrcB family protein [Cellulomonas sp. ATA003]|uniref:fluoride efflux transporter FluC n=1 Tax=Cellulomonas sp. ATA003 TaxID=3073064 RepID=UPI002873F3B2|nr:CrcB family protein [Cellulomonas sp. ATA003]WNB85824.1 CrcB family protein [Cellulomonas sp. ATA003]